MDAADWKTISILGLDPALTTGWAWCDGVQREYGTWNLRGSTVDPHGRRLIRLRQFIEAFSASHAVELIAYEVASFGQKKNKATAAHHEQLRGTIEMVAAEMEIPTLAIDPRSIKAHATNYGAADKRQMLRAAETMLGIQTDSDDVADALFIESYARDRLRREALGICAVTTKGKKRRRITSPPPDLQGRLFGEGRKERR